MGLKTISFDDAVFVLKNRELVDYSFNPGSEHTITYKMPNGDKHRVRIPGDLAACLENFGDFIEAENYKVLYAQTD